MLDPNVGGFVEGTRAEDLVVQSIGGLGLGQVMSYRLLGDVDPTVLTNSSRMSAGILFWSLIIVAIPFQAVARFSSLSLQRHSR